MSSGSKNKVKSFHHHDAIMLNDNKGVTFPSVQIDEKEVATNPKQNIYGYMGDETHFSGSTNFDRNGISVAVWEYMITFFGVKTTGDILSQ